MAAIDRGPSSNTTTRCDPYPLNPAALLCLCLSLSLTLTLTLTLTAVVATPYANELLQLEDSRNSAIIDEVRKEIVARATDVAESPARIAHVEDIVTRIESGDVRLRVRVPAGERSDRRASVMQMTTIQSLAAVGLLNAGTTLEVAGRGSWAAACFAGAGVAAIMVLGGLRRVRNLDKFEKGIRGQ